LQAAFPQAEAVLAMAARHAQAAQALADEVALADTPGVVHGGSLRIAPWLALPPARRANVLRAWLQQRLGQGAPQTLVDRLLLEARGAGPARWPAPGATVCRHRGELAVQHGLAPTGQRQRAS
jgi:tRNA(Ile)-lysidine synthase